jgi:hypothetical protein
MENSFNLLALRRKSKDWLDWNQDNLSEWSDMSTRGLLVQWIRTIQIQFNLLVLYKADITRIISSNVTCSHRDKLCQFYSLLFDSTRTIIHDLPHSPMRFDDTRGCVRKMSISVIGHRY